MEIKSNMLKLLSRQLYYYICNSGKNEKFKEMFVSHVIKGGYGCFEVYSIANP